MLEQFLNRASRFKTSSAKAPRPEDLEGFKKAQRLAYLCATTIASELREGWTEKKTSSLMDTFLRDHGVKTFFHKSLAWFGDRSRFQDFKRYVDFLPSNRVLTADMPVILDTAPIFNGYAGDIGFSFSLEPHPALIEARRFLLEQRKELIRLFASELPLSKIWREVNSSFTAAGYANCHAMYPFQVLGHRLHKIPLSRLPAVGIPFTLHSYWALLSRGLLPELLGPWHDGEKTGIWAIEPHLGAKGFGAKFEEILVVDAGGARWLDNDVPHLNIPKGLY